MQSLNPYGRLLAMILCLFSLSTNLKAQSQVGPPKELIQRYLQEKAISWKLQATDISNVRIRDAYTSQHNKVTHVYLNQTYQGIDIHNAISGFHLLPSGKLAYATNGFYSDIATSINTTTPVISPSRAINAAAGYFLLPNRKPLQLVSQPEPNVWVYENKELSNSPITVRKVYHPVHRGEQTALRLAWDLAIDFVETSDYYSFRIDAVTGKVLDKHNWTLSCTSDHLHTNEDQVICDAELTHAAVPVLQAAPFADQASYRVFPLPLENPEEGDRVLLINPADRIASPYGWHDTNGVDGPEFTITRGNNVHAYLDIDGSDKSKGDEPNGGQDLQFDFPFFPDKEPVSYQEAAVTQLFYVNNYMHDVSYFYGFNEAAGNFQQNNYGKGGIGNDYVSAHAQDGSGTNNANFTTPPDGSSPRIQMYLWETENGKLLDIIEPAPLKGKLETGTAGFGPVIDTIPIEGKVVEAFDNTPDSDKGCQTIVNANEVQGNIAMVNRGLCFFEEKARKVETAGAIALIICNFEESVVGMADVPEVPDPKIPVVSLKASDCQKIRLALRESEVKIKLQRVPDNGPALLDGDFDNGIIVHEYGHGISTRLTGGPSTSGCLDNDEQMGEGWSDFLTLVMTQKPEQDGTTPKAIANYVIRGGQNGTGIRRLPYSTSLSINDQSYDQIIGSTAPHPLGEIWTGVLWDLYWAFIDSYGWDEDIKTGSGGNNIALQLIFDALKLQNCNPGFMDGRNAILAADIINNGGVNECLIWEVFAGRGMGWSADQGSQFNRNDGKEAFDHKPECIQELKIDKAVTQNIKAGDTIEVTLTLTNHKTEDLSQLVISDLIPEGCRFLENSFKGAASIELQEAQLRISLDRLLSLESITFSYAMESSSEQSSQSSFFDDMENGDGKWLFDALEGIDIWQIVDTSSYRGQHAWFVPGTPNENDQVLFNLEAHKVTEEQPVLRFFHRYNSEPGMDGGILQVSVAGTDYWETVSPEKIFRGNYRGAIAYNTFAIPDLQSFWGDSKNYTATYVDLSDYKDQYIYFRFRYGSDDDTADENPIPSEGWYLDDVEILDLFNYSTEACVSSAEGDRACASPDFRGTVVEPASLSTSTEDYGATLADTRLASIFPNPLGNELHLQFVNQQPGDMTIHILSASGVLLQSRVIKSMKSGMRETIPTGDLPSGIYFISIQSDQLIQTHKVVKP